MTVERNHGQRRRANETYLLSRYWFLFLLYEYPRKDNYITICFLTVPRTDTLPVSMDDLGRGRYTIYAALMLLQSFTPYVLQALPSNFRTVPCFAKRILLIIPILLYDLPLFKHLRLGSRYQSSLMHPDHPLLYTRSILSRVFDTTPTPVLGSVNMC